MKKILYGFMVFILLTACSKDDSPGNTVDLAAGKAIAEKDCADCHGMDGRGTSAEIPNLTAQPVQYLVESMHAYRDGGRLHAALQDLMTGMSEADITNIAGFYASLPPLDPIAINPVAETNYQEGIKIAAVCEECHGQKGISSEQGVPSLAGQQPAYLIASTLGYKDGSRAHQHKEDMLIGLEQIDIEKMAMYFASQSAPVRSAPPFGDVLAGKADSAGCGKCHGARGVSRKPMIPSLAGQEPFYLVSAIKSYHNDNRNDEAEMPDRTDEQIENIAAYYSTQLIVPSVDTDLTVERMAAKCDRCHYPPSGKRKLDVPSLRGQSHDYLVKSMKEYRGSDRDNSMMHKMSSRFSDEKIEALATYYANWKTTDED
jgi:cytochrome c553